MDILPAGLVEVYVSIPLTVLVLILWMRPRFCGVKEVLGLPVRYKLSITQSPYFFPSMSLTLRRRFLYVIFGGFAPLRMCLAIAPGSSVLNSSEQFFILVRSSTIR